jgi:tetratricopeptide (TPR) repeat protein
MSNLSEREQSELFKLGTQNRDAGDYTEAIKVFKKLVDIKPNSAAYNGTLGGIFFESGRYRSSLRYFKKAVILSPRSELASLGYFHSLLELGYFRASLKEIERFMRVKQSEDYLEIIKGLNIKKNTRNFKDNRDIIEKLCNYIK